MALNMRIMMKKQGTGAPVQTAGDPYWDNVITLLKGNTYDESPEARTTTLVNASVTSSGYFGDGYSSPGGYGIQVDGNFTYAGDFTIEGWFNVTGQQNQSLFVSGISGNYFAVNHDPSVGQFSVWLNSGTPVATINNSTTGWFHMAFVRMGTLIRLYINGTHIWSSNTNSGGLGHDTTNLKLGCIGTTDEFRITRGIARYTDNFSVPTEAFPTFLGHRDLALRAYIPMRSDVLDSSEQSIVNAVGGISTNGSYTSFTGDPAYLQTDIFQGELHTTSISIWVHPTNIDPYRGIFGPHGNPNYYGLVSQCHPDGKLGWGFGTGSWWSPPNAGPNSLIVANEWQHYVMIKDEVNNLQSMYRNGVLLDAITTSGRMAPQANVQIGRSMDGSGRNWLGHMGDCRIYRMALTQTDVTELFEQDRTHYGI